MRHARSEGGGSRVNPLEEGERPREDRKKPPKAVEAESRERPQSPVRKAKGKEGGAKPNNAYSATLQKL
jgi:hypothetical protein